VATTPSLLRVTVRRQAVIDEVLDHALAVIAESGVGALTVSEVARRLGVRPPSLYKYFPSLHALYDALFARGLAAESAATAAALASVPPGVDRLRAGARAAVRWSVENPALAQLLHWRPVPGFDPSPGVFAVSVDDLAQVRRELAEAVRLGQLRPEADSDAAVRLLTVVISGLLSQQLANQPGRSFDDGDFTRLTDDALDMLFAHYARRP
jgi:AcrR family transcriptional regulator